MELPKHPLNRFSYLTAEYWVPEALKNTLSPDYLRTELQELATRADEAAFCKVVARCKLPPHCQPIIDEARARLTSSRALALQLLKTPTDTKALKALRRESSVLDFAVLMTYQASQRALGPTPDADVNCILRCISRHWYEEALTWAECSLSAHQSYKNQPWRGPHCRALQQLVRALTLRQQGDLARQPFNLEAACLELTRAALAAPYPEGPSKKPIPRVPLSFLWTRCPLNFCYSQLFPEWPWWWIWPARQLSAS